MALPLPFEVKVGSFTMPAADGQQTITGVGFKPKAVILFTAGNESAAAWQGSATGAEKTGLAVAVFTETERHDGVGGSGDPDRLGGTVYEASIDARSSAGFGPQNNCGIYQKVYRVRDSGDSLMGEATLNAMNSDGFVLDWVNVFGYANIIGYIALGGETLVAKVVKWALPSEMGTVERTVVGVGFKPDLVLHLFGSGAFSPVPWLDSVYTDTSFTAFRLGAMDRQGNQWALSLARDSGVPTNSKRSFKTDRVMHGTEYNSVGAVSCELVSMDQDGWTVRSLTNVQATVVVSLALGGVNARVGTLSKPASDSSPATSGLGFQPKGLILCGAMMATAGETDGVRAGFGAASSSTARAALSRVGNDAADPTVELKRTETAKVFYGHNAETTSADLSSFDSDGFTLSWVTNSAAYLVGYIALGPLPQPVHRFDMELNGVGNGWTNVTPDVLLDSPGFSIQYGIAGSGPLDLVASTGTMKIALDNSDGNSAGLMGYYSPRHQNCRPGFQLGIRCRYTYLIPGTSDGRGKFIGRLKEIDPEPGVHRSRKVACLVADWMNEAAITKYNIATQVTKRADEVLTTLLAAVPRQPDSTQFDVADSTFPYSLDNGPTERSTVLTEIQRICQSEFGRCFIKGGLNLWGRLRFEKRTARLIPAPVAFFHGTMQDLKSGNETSKIKNKAKVFAHPRRVDAAATTVLFAKPNQNNPQVAPLATIRITGRYVDPSNPNARIGGTDMVAPVATTDYQMFENANGTGADRTANFTVVATYGANQVDYAITNNHATLPAYVTKLQARGRGLYDYDPLEAEAENLTSIALIGESVVSVDMPYQSEFTVAQAIADFLVATWSSHEPTGELVEPSGSAGVTEASLRFVPRTEAELAAAMALEPGDAIGVSEELSVMNDVYYIQGVGIKGDGDKVAFDWDLQRALVEEFWELGTVGRSELGQTTVLAPL